MKRGPVRADGEALGLCELEFALNAVEIDERLHVPLLPSRFGENLLGLGHDVASIQEA